MDGWKNVPIVIITTVDHFINTIYLCSRFQEAFLANGKQQGLMLSKFMTFFCT
jgi:hypothetical protein